MATTIDQNFFSSLFSTVGSTSKTILDELNESLQVLENPIANAAQMLSEIHGPYNGTSNELNNVLSNITSSLSNVDSYKTTVSEQNTKIFNTSVDIKTYFVKLKSYTSTLKTKPDKLTDYKDYLVETFYYLTYYLAYAKTLLSDSAYQTAYEKLDALSPNTESTTISSVLGDIATSQSLVSSWESAIKNATTDTIKSVINSSYENVIYSLRKTMDEMNEISNSSNLFSYLSKVAEQESTYKDLLESSSSGLDEITNKIAETSSLIGRINDTSSALFDTPLLREFVTRANRLHPEISALIQQNIDKFPYFQQISENVGSLYAITSTISSIDPVSWLKSGTQDFFTNNVLRGTVQPKLFGQVTNMINNADNLLNTLHLRNLPNNFMGLVKQEYSKGSAIAHGFSGAMDVFHANRAFNAKAAILPKLITKVQDKLRLIDTFFPVVQAVKSENKYYSIPVEDTIIKVNSFGRSVESAKTTPETTMKAKEESFSGGRDNENTGDSGWSADTSATNTTNKKDEC